MGIRTTCINMWSHAASSTSTAQSMSRQQSLCEKPLTVWLMWGKQMFQASARQSWMLLTFHIMVHIGHSGQAVSYDNIKLNNSITRFCYDHFWGPFLHWTGSTADLLLTAAYIRREFFDTSRTHFSCTSSFIALEKIFPLYSPFHFIQRRESVPSQI